MMRFLTTAVTAVTLALQATAADPIIAATARLDEQRTRIEGHVLDLRATVAPNTKEYSEAMRAYRRASASMNEFLRNLNRMNGPASFDTVAEEAIAVNADIAGCVRALSRLSPAEETRSLVSAAAMAPAVVQLMAAVVHRFAERKERKNTEAVLKHLQWKTWEEIQ